MVPAPAVGRLSPLAVQVIVEAAGRDRMPFPLIANDIDHDSHGAYLDARRDIGQDLADGHYDRLDDWASTLLAPDLRIEMLCVGYDVTTHPESIIRVHGTRRGDDGYVTVQHPRRSNTPSYVTIHRCDAVELAAAVVAQLPDTPAGSLGEVTLTDTDSATRSVFDNDDDHGLNILRPDTWTLSGSIQVRPFATLDWGFHPDAALIRFKDHTSGRYQHRQYYGQHLATPITATQLTSEINRHVAATVKLIREQTGLTT